MKIFSKSLALLVTYGASKPYKLYNLHVHSLQDQVGTSQLALNYMS